MGSLTERLVKFSDVSLADKHKAVLMLQWLTVIGTSYLSLFSGGRINYDVRVFALIIALLISALVLQRLPPRIFYSDHFDAALVLVDAVFIVIGISLSEFRRLKDRGAHRRQRSWPLHCQEYRRGTRRSGRSRERAWPGKHLHIAIPCDQHICNRCGRSTAARVGTPERNLLR